MSGEDASKAFQQYVLSPIPQSVTNIRADQPKNFQGYRYTFRFNMNRDDLSLLTDSGPFVKVWNVKYDGGYLQWGWDRPGGLLGLSRYGGSMLCYDHTRAPGWFRPGLWDNPETYAFRKKGELVNTEIFSNKGASGPTDARVLLYNESEAEAYFVVTYYED